MKFFEHSEVELIAVCATDEDVARAAWVSTKGDDSKLADSLNISGLIGYLMKNRHGTPFEHTHFKFFVKTPMFVRTEFMRHRVGFSYNEESGRYKKLEPHFYRIPKDRNLVQSGKPGHYTFGPGTEKQVAIARESQSLAAAFCYSLYESQLEAGVAREVARNVLPVETMTSFYVTCNARSLMSFLALRTENEDATFVSHPLWEIQEVAGKMEDFFGVFMPLTYKAFNDNGRVAP